MEVARNRPGTPVMWCLAAAALFGASTPASKWLLDAQVGPLTLAGLLYLGAAVPTAVLATAPLEKLLQKLEMGSTKLETDQCPLIL